MRNLINVLLIIILLLLVSSPLLAGSPSDDVNGHKIGLFSNFNMNGETGDCGGFELWLFKKGNALIGQLAVYEGNCKSEKKKIEDVKYYPKSGVLSFKAEDYTNDFFWTFKGTLKKDHISGTFRVFEKVSKQNTFKEKVILSKVP